MCGIAGAWTREAEEAPRAVERMCRAMTARGPDGAGTALLSTAGDTLAVGHRRLAVIDPSPAGHQPMRDPTRGTVIVFNGFIANFVELRRRLEREGECFASQCDTEVVLKAYGRYGPACVRLLRGMFAFAVWDPRDETLFLARDPFGIKPLYYYHRGDRLLFASQVRALLASGLVPRTLSIAGLQAFLAFGAVREPLTAIDGVYALPAGHTMTVHRGRLEPARFWHPPPPGAERGKRNEERASRSPLTRRDATVRTLRALLVETVAHYLTSDVPVGLFLSGGLDSAALAALASRAPNRPSRLVAVSLVDGADDPETTAMRAVAQAAGAEHVVIPLRWSMVEAWLPHAFAAMDQPTFDGINTYAVARAAAGSGLKVALSGLGADELFGGYGYARRVALLELARRLPPSARRVAATAAGLLPSRKGEKARAWLEGELPAGGAHELLRRLFLPHEVERLVRAERGGMSAEGHEASVPLAARTCALPPHPGDEALLDLTGYTRDVLLRDTDCMSMAHGLEVRVPYLDHVLAEFVLRLPVALRAAPGKRLLADAVRDLLPPAPALPGRKRGFVLPIDRWLRGPLRREVEATFRAPPAAAGELLVQEEILRLWRRFLAGDASWHGVWALYALCRWLASLPEVEGELPGGKPDPDSRRQAESRPR